MLSCVPRQRINIDILDGPAVRGALPVHATTFGSSIFATQPHDLARQSLDLHPRAGYEPSLFTIRWRFVPSLLVAPSDPLVPCLHLPGQQTSAEQTRQLP